MEKKTFIPAHHGQLEAMVASSTQNNAIAIMCHPHSQMGGTMNNKVVTTVVRAWQSIGYPTIRFNFRGVGESTGSFDEGKGEQEDLATVLRWALLQFGNVPLILGGFSFGAYVALSFCQRYTPKTLLLIAPPANSPDFATLHLPKSKAYLIVAAEDEIIPPRDILTWTNSEPFESVITVPGASHFFHGKLLAIKDFVTLVFHPREKLV